MAVKDGLPATDFSRKDREWVKNVVDGTTVPDGLPATDLSRMNRDWIKAVVDEAGGGGGDITVEALEVTENNTYTAPEGKAYSPVTVNVPVGDASEFKLLNTTSLTEAVNSIKIDYDSSWEDYDIIFAVCDFVLSSADYIYLDFNTETPAGNHYTHNLIKQWFVVESLKTGDTWDSTFMTTIAPVHTAGFPTYLFIKCYQGTNTFTTASTIKIYGGKLS